ncbi:LysR substrate-binding domain-containing protein [Palleronia abyssalis]|uniref:Glycine cleavage system transcriptional activator n=1 Tax=Palleronia abyssalis TaxID=1501240 RepID=A0A2R8BU67_9RHOB|nr:LysR substrate-binding domain-containing protein [Palleronia abyssalis]SPJ23688.1 Glycine cleavage system transcriptional activator [Palleronia abyssalis]
MKRPYDLPSMTALVCFEAAARHQSFKTAARELNVTPAAVSHQIKALETELGRDLFRRHHRGVDLTEMGAFLFVNLRKGFEGMSDTIREIRGRAETDDVVVRATTAVSAFWLTPKISAFWKTHPEIVISQIVMDTAASSGSTDLGIHYGPVNTEMDAHHVLFRDRIVALASPEFAERIPSLSLKALAGAPLIHVAAADTDWTGWADWFSTVSDMTPTGKSITVNNYMIALQMAQDGIGAVLGWERLVGPLLEAGKLVHLSDAAMPSPWPFYLAVHPRASPRARVFRDWLISQ